MRYRAVILLALASLLLSFNAVGLTAGEGETILAGSSTAAVRDNELISVASDTALVDESAVMAPTAAGIADWTLIFYLAGDNNLASYMQNDFDYISSAGSSASVNVLVLFDKSSSGDTAAYYVTSGADVSISLSSIRSGWTSEVNMGDPNSLVAWSQYCVANYPAEHYMIVPQDHGGAYVGCCWDDTSNDRLTLSEIGSAMASIKTSVGHNLDIVLFNDCLMSTIDVAYQIAPYADYMVASETIGWTSNFDNEYYTIITYLQSNPGMSPRDLAVYLIQQESLVDSSTYGTQAVAAVNLSRVNTLASYVNDLSIGLRAAKVTEPDNVRLAREATYSFEGPYTDYYERLIDLGELCENVLTYVSNPAAREAAQLILDDLGAKGGTLGSTILIERATASVTCCYGISVYFPMTLSTYDSSYTSGNSFTLMTGWDELLVAYRSSETLANDGYEADDTYAAATAISIGESQSHNINDYGTDVDWYRFTVTEYCEVIIRTSISGSGDTVIWLYDESGVPDDSIGYDDNSGTGASSLLRIDWLAPGTYYFKVTSYNSLANVPSYVIALNVTGYHSAIHIASDQEMYEMAEIEGWAGTGAVGDPFIIRDLRFMGDGASTSVRISDVSYYFSIENCSFTGQGAFGIILINCPHATVAKCSIELEAACGLLLVSCDGALIEDNTFTSSEMAINIRGCVGATVRGNLIADSSIVLSGDSLEHYSTHNIASTNLINGLPVYYAANMDMSSVTVPSGQGQIILVNVTHARVSGAVLAGGWVALHIAFTADAVIEDCVINGPEIGMLIEQCVRATIANNDLTGCQYGILSVSSSGGALVGNDLSACMQGIVLEEGSNDSVIYGNRVSGGAYGLLILGSHNNRIADNVFGNNTLKGALVSADSSYNTFVTNSFINNNLNRNSTDRSQATDNGSSEAWSENGRGNYWSDWTTPDRNRDGVVDVAYPMLGNSDPYPLTTSALMIPKVSISYPSASSHFASSFTMTWSGSDAGSGLASYLVQVDSGTWIDAGLATSFEMAGLSEGVHVLRVKVLDQAGYSSVASVTVYIDMTDPVLTIGTVKTYYNTSSVTLSWSGSDGPFGIAYYTVSLDGGATVNIGTSASRTFSGLADGLHTVTVTVYDLAGLSTAKEVTFTIDTVAPSLVLIEPSPGSTATSSISVSWSGDDTLSGILGYQSRIDEGSWSTLSSSTARTFTGLVDGEHTVEVRALDVAGNVRTVSVTFTADAGGPLVTIVSPLDGSMMAYDHFIIEWQVDEDASVARFVLSLDCGAWTDLSLSSSAELSGLSDGEHSITVRAYDAEGNWKASTVRVMVDAAAPSIGIAWPLDGSYVDSTEQVVAYEISEEAGVASISAVVDGGETFEVDGPLALAQLSQGQHTVEITVTDLAGRSATSTVTFVVDSMAPTITGSPQGTDVSVDSGIVIALSEPVSSITILVNGSPYDVAINGTTVMVTSLPLACSSEYRVEAQARDHAGNVGYLNWTFATRATVTVTGTVLDSGGAPLSGATVNIGESSATTDAAGAFMMEVAPGNHTMTVKAPGMEPITMDVSVPGSVDLEAVRMESTFPLPLVAAVIAVIVAASAAAVLLARRRKR